MNSEVGFLETCSALMLGDAGDVPEWLMVLPAGTSRGVDGRGPYHLTDPDGVVTASMQGGRPLAFDYNHQTVFAALNGSASPASGWIDKLDVRDGAIWAHVDWTKSGHAAVASKEYRFVSPTFLHDKNGQVQKLVSSALVNSPNLIELPAIASALRAASHVPNGDITPMDKELQGRLAVALGLPTDTAVAALVTHAEQHKAVATGAPDPSKYVPMAAFTELQQKVATLTTEAAAKNAEALVASAGTKITPAMRDWALGYASTDPEGFGKWLAAAPVIVAAGADPKLEGDGPTEDGAATAQELAVCTNLGITIDAYRATNKKG
jgi:phage I-like protein